MLLMALYQVMLPHKFLPFCLFFCLRNKTQWHVFTLWFVTHKLAINKQTQMTKICVF